MVQYTPEEILTYHDYWRLKYQKRNQNFINDNYHFYETHPEFNYDQDWVIWSPDSITERWKNLDPMLKDFFIKHRRLPKNPCKANEMSPLELIKHLIHNNDKLPVSGDHFRYITDTLNDITLFFANSVYPYSQLQHLMENSNKNHKYNKIKNYITSLAAFNTMIFSLSYNGFTDIKGFYKPLFSFPSRNISRYIIDNYSYFMGIFVGIATTYITLIKLPKYISNKISSLDQKALAQKGILNVSLNIRSFDDTEFAGLVVKYYSEFGKYVNCSSHNCDDQETLKLRRQVESYCVQILNKTFGYDSNPHLDNLPRAIGIYLYDELASNRKRKLSEALKILQDELKDEYDLNIGVESKSKSYRNYKNTTILCIKEEKVLEIKQYLEQEIPD